jgi:hypothetical protein
MFSWLLIIFGYCISMAIAADPAGWDASVFTVVHHLPFSPYSWAVLLAVSTIIYNVGEVMPTRFQHRGVVLILGAVLCSAWCLGMALSMSRMVYVMPKTITILWPLVMFFIACLYASRAIVYANTFSGVRWNSNPYQAWSTLFLMSASLAQIIIGVMPSSVFTEVEKPVAVQLALVNFMGASVVMFGLHMKNKNVGLSLELYGAASLVATIGWYCAEVIHSNILAGTTLGFGLCEAFLFATFHRGIQITILKYARWKNKPHLEKRVAAALNVPPTVIGPLHGFTYDDLPPPHQHRDDDPPEKGGHGR